MASFCWVPVMALSSREVADAIVKARVLTTPITIQIEGGSVGVSTYLNTQATSKDCKIDAALIAKAVIDLAPDDIARVTVYFYNTTMTKCDAVSVTAGDIKSFGSGSTSKEQLLSTLVITSVKVLDQNNKVAAFLESGTEIRSSHSLKTRINGPVMEVSAECEPWASDRDLKLEAIRLAEKASEVSSPSIRKIRVEFLSGNNSRKIRRLVVDMPTLINIHNGIETLLQPLSVVEISNDNTFSSAAGKFSRAEDIDVQALTALPGPAFEDRSNLLTRIKSLRNLGIGVEPFVDSFLRIEEDAKNGDDVTKGVSDLQSKLDEQEKLHKTAQEFVPLKKGTTNSPVNPTVRQTSLSAWDPDKSTGAPPADIVKNVLVDHKTWMAYYERRWYRNGHRPEDFPNYVKLLDFFAATLRTAKRIPEAEIYEKKAADIRESKKKESVPKDSVKQP